MDNPCIGCPEKEEDAYGLYCDIVCGKHTAYLHHQSGVKEVLDIVKSLENPCAFQDGECIPKYEAGFNGYEKCRQDIMEAINER